MTAVLDLEDGLLNAVIDCEGGLVNAVLSVNVFL